jgi:putative Mg2+ transporter-C (MgtC) family protein
LLDTLLQTIVAAGGLLGRLALAAVLGALIGYDRERSGKPAGLRTNLLICVGAALLTELSLRVARAGWADGFQADPARIAAQIVSGIGFLGAGTILQARGSVVGLTTAATMWVVAAIGMAVGAGDFILAIAATAIVIVTLMLIPRFDRLMAPYPRLGATLEVVLAPDPEAVGRIQRLLVQAGLSVEAVDVDRRENHLKVRYSTRGKERELGDAVRILLGEATVRHVHVD